jgi:two-component system sensor histidine kinase BarA
MANLSHTKQHIDWAQADDTTGTHPGLAEELLCKLLEDLRETQALFQADYASENWLSLRERAHKLHGACCYCGIPVLKRAVQVLERATDNNPTSAKIKPKLNAFNRSVDGLFAAAATDARLHAYQHRKS